MSGKWFKSRLNYLADRFAGKAGWTDKKLDSVPIAYYRGTEIEEAGSILDVEPILFHAQVGRSQTELLMTNGMMMHAADRDFFIFDDDLPFVPEEGDIIFDENYTALYCKVSTRFTRSTFTHTNETYQRMRVRTVIVKVDKGLGVPSEIATWLRAGILPIGYKSRVEIPDYPPETPDNSPEAA